jgi:hypothetical protein
MADAPVAANIVAANNLEGVSHLRWQTAVLNEAGRAEPSSAEASVCVDASEFIVPLPWVALQRSHERFALLYE